MESYSNPDVIYNYKYESVNKSLVAPILRPWWKLVLKVVPLNTSANLISILGNLGSFLALIVLVAFGASRGPSCPWLFAIAALGIGFYHTLDCVDGMQARRIGSSGPLGEFIDHWFDSFNCFFIPLGMIAAFPVIPTWLAIAFLSLGILADWITLREVEKTNVLYFGPLSTDEGVVLYFLFNLSVAFLGYDFWSSPAPFLGFPPVFVMAGLGTLGFVCTIVSVLAKNRMMSVGNLLVEALLIAPVVGWIFWFDAAFLDRSALIGGLFVIGFVGSRFIGDLLRSRLLGFQRPLLYIDVLICDIGILGVIAMFNVFPNLPRALAVVPVVLMAVTTMLALLHQFDATLRRVYTYLGIAIFDVPSARPQPESVQAASPSMVEADSR